MKNNLPLVSISCMTFNHVDYLRACFEGFLMQQTNFIFEILVHDDASTDGTKAIIEEYTTKHPSIFFPLYQPENIYSKGERGLMVRFNFSRARGKYIATCDGDDYWTDPLKLQKQVDFLEQNDAYSFCFHDVLEIKQNSDTQVRRIGNRKIDTTVDLKSVLIENNFPTASLVVRTSAYPTTDAIISKTSKGDYTLVVHFAEKGLGKYIPDVMAAYRMHNGGVWSLKDDAYKLAENIKFYNLLYDYFIDPSIRKVIAQKRNKTIESQSFITLREGQIFKGMKAIVGHWNCTTDKRLRGASIRKILSAVKSGITNKKYCCNSSNKFEE